MRAVDNQPLFPRETLAEMVRQMIQDNEHVPTEIAYQTTKTLKFNILDHLNPIFNLSETLVNISVFILIVERRCLLIPKVNLVWLGVVNGNTSHEVCFDLPAK